jgi:DNA-binding transcriptional MerR regulator
LGLDTVALTKVIRLMQQAGASADDIRQMLAENRRRAPEVARCLAESSALIPAIDRP